jgi:hypothetical protein
LWTIVIAAAAIVVLAALFLRRALGIAAPEVPAAATG